MSLLLVLLKEQPVGRQERKITHCALQTVLLAFVIVESRLLGLVESPVVLGTSKVLSVLLVVLPEGFPGALEHLKALAAVDETVTCDQVWTMVTNQIVVSKVSLRGELERARQTALVSMRFQLVSSHLACRHHLDSTNYQWGSGLISVKTLALQKISR